MYENDRSIKYFIWNCEVKRQYKEESDHKDWHTEHILWNTSSFTIFYYAFSINNNNNNIYLTAIGL